MGARAAMIAVVSAGLGVTFLASGPVTVTAGTSSRAARATAAPPRGGATATSRAAASLRYRAAAAAWLTAASTRAAPPAQATVSSRSRAGPAPSASTRPVVLIGIGGLRWADISAAATPAIWGLAARGTVGSLVDTTTEPLTCPADAWLTLNAGASAAVIRPAGDACPAFPAVTGARRPGRPAPASIADMGRLERANTAYSPYRWGALAAAAGPGRCATAVGPGAALAMASAAGAVRRYLARPAAAPPAAAGCALTAVDLGTLPAPGPRSRPRTGAAQRRPGRAEAVHAVDREVAAIAAAAAPGAVLVVTGLGDNAGQHLRALIIAGSGFGPGLVTSPSARQPGVALLTDLTASVYAWRGRPVPAALTGAPLRSGPRGPLAAVIRSLAGRDIAEQADLRSTGWALFGYGAAELALLLVIALLLRGSEPGRIRGRAAACSAAAVVAAAVPAGTFLANLAPWPLLPHPALMLWGIGLAWAAVIGSVALAGPWRRDPLGPPGFVAAVTLAVIAADVLAGSRLQLEAPFGLSLLRSGRFYGIGNNVLAVYGVAGIVAGTWAAVAARRSRWPRAALAAAAAVAALTVVIAGWPAFGAKVGGTIALAPAFGVLLAAAAGVRLTPRRLAGVALSGAVLIAIFALVNYLVPATGASHLGGFADRVLHGGAGGTLARKISANLHSLTADWFAPLIPVTAAAALAALVWPLRLRLFALARARRREPMLGPALLAMWLVAVLGWLADDSGVTVAARALPFALPLAVAVAARLGAPSAGGSPPAAAAGPVARARGRPPRAASTGQARSAARADTAS